MKISNAEEAVVKVFGLMLPGGTTSVHLRMLLDGQLCAVGRKPGGTNEKDCPSNITVTSKEKMRYADLDILITTTL